VRAIVMKEYGGPECLVPAERPDPVAKPGWAVVRLRTAALNWHDVLVRQGRYQSPLPHVPGADGAGTGAETGEDVLVVPSLWWGDGESAPGPSWEILPPSSTGRSPWTKPPPHTPISRPEPASARSFSPSLERRPRKLAPGKEDP
jgi:zinc-binding alcohol dehydrogenase/oxidoreductase